MKLLSLFKRKKTVYIANITMSEKFKDELKAAIREEIQSIRVTINGEDLMRTMNRTKSLPCSRN